MIIKEVDTKSILGKCGLPGIDYSLNPYVGCGHACRYCYAAYMMTYTNHSETWGNFVDVKNWPPLINIGKYEDKRILIGSVTDPYQPLEVKYKRTQLALEQLKGSGCRIYILTKSDLILRDIELIKKFPDTRISFSINTLDDTFQKQMDKAPSIERRIYAMRSIRDAGIDVSCFIAPIFPGITNVEKIILAVKDYCGTIWIDKLNLRGSRLSIIMDFITTYYPELISLYKDIYYRQNKTYWECLSNEIDVFIKNYNLYSSNTINKNVKPCIVNYLSGKLQRRESYKEKEILKKRKPFQGSLFDC